jgi:acyl-CoA synthetase (NDP forming)
MRDWRDALFVPRRVAVVGASATPGKAGSLFMRNLTAPEAGFTGDVVAIHPTADEILGCPSYPRLDTAPDPIDMAVIVTPPPAAPSVIEDCGAAGVPVVVVITGGFAETGPKGAELQRQLIETAAAHGVRVIGPNCFGVISTASGLNASLSIGLPRRGGVSLVTQSGAYGMAAYTRSIDDAMGFSKIVALGNKADIDEAELLEFLGRDPETKVIALLLESISDGRRLFETVAAVAPNKPVVALKTGRHPGAQRAAASHTAALSGDAAVAFAALRQAGAHLVEDGLSLLDVAASLDRQPPLRGRNVAIITNSGGTGVELTDLLEAQGLAVPALSPTLQSTIKNLLPPQGSPVNPVDVTTDWPRFAEMYGGTIKALTNSDEIDAVIPVLLQRSALMPEVGDAVIAAHNEARRGGSTKPIHVCWVAPRAADANREKLLAAGIPCHSWPAATAKILAATVAQPPRRQAPIPAGTSIPVPSSSSADGWASSGDAFSLLQAAGFPVAPFAIVSSAEEAAAKAEEMGFPIVLKAERAGLTHKSDAGAVRVGLRDAETVVETFTDFERRLGVGPALMQRQSAPGLEIVFGARRDKLFGPIVMAGLGGVWIEALNDVALRVAPINDSEALTMLAELQGRKLLAGFRGRAPIDLACLGRLIADLSQWFVAANWLAEMDLNPIIADSASFAIVDARMRVDEIKRKPT